jgi:type IV secretory pathway TraG/TraD family ATPase VirD4
VVTVPGAGGAEAPSRPNDWASLTSDSPDGVDLGGYRVRLGTYGRRTYSSEEFRPVLVLGPQRSYKTSGFAVPTILEWDGPALVTSVRRDVLDDTHKFRGQRGRIYVFDPAGALKGTPYERFRHSWDILDHCSTWDDCVRTANALTEARELRGLQDGDFWYSLAAQLLAPHLFAAARHGRSMSKVVEWIKTQEEFEVRSLLQATGNQVALTSAEDAWQREDRARSSVYTTASSVLRVFDYSDVGIDEPPFIDLESFLASPADTLYLCAPPEEQEEYRDLFTGLVRTVVRMAYAKNNRASDLRMDRPAGTEPAGSAEAEATPLLMLLDEAGNIAPLQNLTTLATTSAGTKIQLVTIFHDLSQMQDVYGLYAARSIVSNHSALVILPGARDDETLAYVENLVRGERIANTKEGTWSTPKWIRGMRRGTALLVYENLRPVVLTLRSRFNNSLIAGRAEGAG